ncbi:helix-turn-helix transcriptional regulator [Kribbella sp. NBC_00359]|uniref:helix-turn-helix transcriptional regulator n=1 Tax=Kribbella sp. NBC_00359 TaxID=2975966 RepID=UPI002E23CC2F
MASEPSLVERADEARLVESAIKRAASAGGGGFVLFDGPPGIGKTSMLREAMDAALTLGFIVLSARGMDLEQGLAWGMVHQMLRLRQSLLTARTGSSDAADLARSNLSGLANERRVPPAPSEYALMHSLFWLISDIAVDRPLLIAADDLHWADLPSLRFLAYLSARIEGLPIVVVAATRSGSARAEHILSAIAENHETTVRTLRPLSLDAIGNLLREVLGYEPDRSFVYRCHELTRGNPLLLHELAKHVKNGGNREALGSLTALDDAPIPSVAKYVDLQLRRLSPQARQAMQALAVLGTEARPDQIAQVAHIRVPVALDGLNALQANELVAPAAPPGTFVISHPLIRASVYDGISPLVRARMHTDAARMALRAYDTEIAATHLLRVPPNLALDINAPEVLSAAAATCIARGAVEGAVAYLRRLLDEELGTERVKVLTQLGMMEAGIDAASARRHLSSALAGERDPGRREMIQLALVAVAFLDSGPGECLKTALQYLADDTDQSIGTKRALQADAVLMSAMTPVDLGTKAYIDNLLTIPSDSSVGGRMLDAAVGLLHAFACERPPAIARALNATGDHALLAEPGAEPLLAAAWSTLELCDAPELLPRLDRSIETLRSGQAAGVLAAALCYRAIVTRDQGNLQEAIFDAYAAWEITVTSGSRTGAAFTANVLIRALVESGRFADAETILRRVKSLWPPSLLDYVYSDGESAILLARGGIDQALLRAMRTGESCSLVRLMNPVIVGWRGVAVYCLHRKGRVEEAREIARENTSHAEKWGTPRAIGVARRVAAIPESGDNQLALLAESASALETTPANLELSQSLFALGDAHRRAKHVTEARRDLQSALDLAGQCGALPLTERIIDTLRLLGVRAASARRTGPASLTPGERRVADLAASGLSNRDIAQSLYITVKTVEVHLSSTFRKLEIKSRKELPRVLEDAGREPRSNLPTDT